MSVNVVTLTLPESRNEPVKNAKINYYYFNILLDRINDKDKISKKGIIFLNVNVRLILVYLLFFTGSGLVWFRYVLNIRRPR